MAKKIVKKVEIPMVQIEIEVSEEFYKRIQEGKKELKKNYGWELDDGGYIEKAMDDLVIIISNLKRENQILHGWNSTNLKEDADSSMYN